ncbi:Phosphatidylinositol 4-phosphate 5-kinase (PIPK-D3/GPCR-PIPK) [Phytophthora nicotianae]|uniref:Phosphatidylinositol 4-phosphate 5-kinase (PIPK-D3/GPCR-PIPK) n=1 Tax=Phytophthora nicotianae TaxID=4792 RepID=A0A0W8D0I3_PHYNI|nr:Phosphatidylinositol 4-phosphate 5-kinase (PIPK-D3/GPCR-PIPK) [Phytophthora nicotianae]
MMTMTTVGYGDSTL